MKKEELKEWFDNQDWDLETPSLGHEDRFLNKLYPKPKKRYLFPMSVAATFLLSIGILFFILNKEKQPEVQFSKELQATNSYFNSIIDSKKETLKNIENPQNKKIITDALLELQKLEKDYKKLENEIIKNGENEQIIYAMIVNFESRISFLKTILEKIKDTNNLKNKTNEKYI